MDEQRVIDRRITDGMYRVTLGDGSVPAWEVFVLGARDPAAAAALRSYATAGMLAGYDPRYVAETRERASDFAAELALNGPIDCDGGAEPPADTGNKELMLAAIHLAEHAAHAYAVGCDVGDERTWAFDVFECIRTCTRK